MKDHRRKSLHKGDPDVGFAPKGRSYGGDRLRASSLCKLAVVFGCLVLSVLTFSAFRLFGVSVHPVLVTPWQQSRTLNSISAAASGNAADLPAVHLHHQIPSPIALRRAVSSPDLVLLFVTLNASSLNPISSSDLLCLYFPPSSSSPNLSLRPVSSDLNQGILRCPLQPPGHLVSVGISAASSAPRPILPLQWDLLVYESLLDSADNSTIVFAKGLNLRPGRLSDPSRYDCVFGWDLSRPRFLITSAAITAAQEVIRCETPLSVLRRMANASPKLPPIMVSIRDRGGRGAHPILPSVAIAAATTAHSVLPSGSFAGISKLRQSEHRHQMCICTMLRNQARSLAEWIIYHGQIGVGQWFIYDNNSDDEIEDELSKLSEYNITRRVWPWVKSQEAGFAHCAVMARGSCDWVGFIDVDEFLFLPSPELTLDKILTNYTVKTPEIAELRTTCHTFGPSGQRTAPPEGVTTGYTCRTAAPERHKSIVRPAALSTSLVNVVHHFHLRSGLRYVNIDRSTMVVNHYKYQAWEVFKEKFYRRVATYVVDWQDEENAGSKDRAPGLGTRPVEPPDWPSRFCEVRDKGLRDRVLRIFADPSTRRLPWQRS
ncbi:glycosyltransferase family 92 protein Os08g0121900-like [Wolffia australiana]